MVSASVPPSSPSSSPSNRRASASATLAALALLFLACSSEAAPPPPSGGPSAGETASTAVARVGSRTLTQADLEEIAAAELAQIENQRYQVMERGIARLVDEALLAAEAERLGKTPEDLMAAEINGAVEPVTDEEVAAWYEANQSRIGPRPKEQVLPQIRQFLERQRADGRRAAYLASLRERFPVEVFLEPPRMELDLARATYKGSEAAPVTLVEYSDFQCPACQRVNPDLARLKTEYGDRLRVAFVQNPLTSIHPQAFKAAEAALCARDQGRFWEMHDALFADQGNLEEDALVQRARSLGLEAEAFETCLDSGEHTATVRADLDSALARGITSTPSIFINGRPVQLMGGTPIFDQLARVVDDELARAERGADG